MTSVDANSLRSAFSAALASGNKFLAMRAARSLLAEDSGVRQLSFVARELERNSSLQLGLKPLKIGLLSSFSIEFIKQPLKVHSFINGIDAQIYLPGFAQFQQEVRNPDSNLYAFSPDVTILAVEGADWIPEIYRDYIERLDVGFNDVLSRFREELRSLIAAFRERSKATLLIHNFVPPVWRHLGILDPQSSAGQGQLVEHANQTISEICRSFSGVMTVDYAALVSRAGALRWYDERMSHYAKAPIAMDMLPQLACEYLRFFRGLTGQTKKCLVLDLDNTLWGGVLGEEGPAGIELGSVYPGSAYLAFQREILNLRKRGILLAIASKNNSADVDEVFATNRNMLLKKEHFAGMQIHWQSKSESLREIARQLNIGLEHIVFADDNPAECEEVNLALPMVHTLRMPQQPEQFVRVLLEEGLFDGLTFSAEDQRRGEMYRQREEAEALRENSGSVEDFLRSLEMELTFAPVDKTSLARSAQLTQKTNQFNVTTLRFSETEVSERMNHPDWILATVNVRDRFGDNGVVGVMMAKFDAGSLALETFLLSCRVIGRNVETAMLAYLCEQSLRRGIRMLQGRIVPTVKNTPARDLFERHGFHKDSEKQSGDTLWSLDLSSGGVPWPESMKVILRQPLASL
jgi:FkbH-like protein